MMFNQEQSVFVSETINKVRDDIGKGNFAPLLRDKKKYKLINVRL